MTRREKRWWSRGQLKVKTKTQIILRLLVKICFKNVNMSIFCIFKIWCLWSQPSTGLFSLLWYAVRDRIGFVDSHSQTGCPSPCTTCSCRWSCRVFKPVLQKDCAHHNSHFSTIFSFQKNQRTKGSVYRPVLLWCLYFSVLLLSLVCHHFIVLLPEFNWTLISGGTHRECVSAFINNEKKKKVRLEDFGILSTKHAPLLLRTVGLLMEKHPRGWKRLWWARVTLT